MNALISPAVTIDDFPALHLEIPIPDVQENKHFLV
jgi:hypothetical protein